jgi:hypothetical protein
VDSRKTCVTVHTSFSWRNKRGKWEELTKGGVEEDEKESGGFSFGFGGDDDDADIP